MVASLFVQALIIAVLIALAVGVVAMFLNRELDRDIARFYTLGFDAHRSKTLSRASRTTVRMHSEMR